MKEGTKYQKEDRHTYSVADEFLTNSTTTKKILRKAFLVVRFSSRVLHYVKKIVFRNRVTDPITFTVSLLCSAQPR